MIQGKTGTIFTHITGWIIFLLLPVLFITGQNENSGIAQIILSPFYWLFLMCYALLFYIHTYFVFPAWYARRKYLFYGGYLVLFFILIILLKPFDKLVQPHDRMFEPRVPPLGMRGPQPGSGRVDIVSIILYFLTLALSIAVISVRQLRKSEERAQRAETQKARAELSYLKAQINPHFLFNTLNNIFVLASNRHENTADAIMKLSNILRYVTEEVSDDFVPLEKEISCIRDYIDLQQLRLSKTIVEFESIEETTGLLVPPMVLMTYIENAFKFGVSNHSASLIKISIAARENGIEFVCRNTLFETGNKERTGIGLINTRQRLEYLYSGRYELTENAADGHYTVNLKITN